MYMYDESEEGKSNEQKSQWTDFSSRKVTTTWILNVEINQYSDGFRTVFFAHEKGWNRFK